MSHVDLFCKAAKEAKQFSESQNLKIEYLQKIGYTAKEIIICCGENILKNIALAKKIRDNAARIYNEQALEIAENNYAEALYAAAKLGQKI